MGALAGTANPLNSETKLPIRGFDVAGIRTIVDHGTGLMTAGAGQPVDRKCIDHPIVGILSDEVVRAGGIGYHRDDVLCTRGLIEQSPCTCT